MTKNLLRPFLWGILSFSVLSSCRTEDNISKQNQEDKRFATFTSQSGKTINYANGFASLMIKYDELNKSNLSGIANKPLLSASSDKNGSTATGSYIEFNVRSQVIKNSDGNIWVVFPKVENGTVISLIVSLLSEKETYLSYYSVDKSDEFYKTNTPLFQEAYNRYKKKNMRLALSASTSIQFMANNDCENRPDERCSEIEEVIITNPRPIKTPNKDITLPTGDQTDNSIPGSDCGTFGDCFGGGGGGGTGTGTQQQDACSQALTNNSIAKNLLTKGEISRSKTAVTATITSDKNEKTFSFGKDKDGNYKTTSIKEGNGGSAQMSVTDPNLTIEGGAHTHTADVYNVASSGDIYQFYKAHSANNNFNYYYTFSQGNNNYVYTIVNQTAFDNFIKNYPEGTNFDMTTQTWNQSSKIGKDYRNIINSFQNSNMPDDDIMDLVMAAMIRKYNMGIALSKADSNGNFNGIYAKEIKDPNDPSKTTYAITPDCNL
ncbi:hypothetical protein C8J95_102337 [Elizabethkingia sp. YR214]|uniref:hypothetical protein n=1 Tax=Elizabethkingia sp. YR214 TaxID=2135667 RepID=UPI000D31B183|nr:hypothetical protein [Elizabethkingia sp. YR214]PUB34671.1 hypothetical protein C8J95_102337 [Elizabethkingia sp. YR214]